MHDWILGLIQWVLDFWQEQMNEVINVITNDPHSFMGGGPWSVIQTVHAAIVGVGLALVMLYFAIGFFESAVNFRDFRRPEYLLKHFIRFAFAKGLVQHSLAVMLWIFNLVKGIILNVANIAMQQPDIPQGVESALDELGFFKSIPAWLIVMIGCLLIVGLSFMVVLQVYGRFFKVYLYAAASPMFLASYAWDGMENAAKAFLKGFFGVCVEGLLIVIACLIYQSLQLSAAGDFQAGDSPILYLTMYMAKTIFGMFVLIGAVKLSGTLVKEMIGG